MKNRLLSVIMASVILLGMLAGFNVSPAYALGDANMVVSAGWSETFVIKSDGSLWGWGANSEGTVGNGTKTEVLTPVKIMDGVTSVSSYYHHTVAVKKDGSLWGWGSNRYGALGPAKDEIIMSPIKLLDNVKMASAGRHTTVVVKNDNTLWLAGEVGLGDGKMGDPKAGFRQVMSNVKFAAAGEDVVFAIKADNSLWGWGFNEKGQVGNGSKTGDNNLAAGGKLILTAVKVMDGVTQVASTRAATMAVGGDGSLWMWGDGVLPSPSLSPAKVMENVRQASLSVEGTTYAVIKADGTVWGWGDSVALRGTVGSIKAPVKLYDAAKMVSLGNRHLAVVKNDNTLWMAGSNYYGRLGFGEKSGDRALKQLLADVMSSDSTLATYQGASSWATADLDKAQGYGLITDRMKSNMKAPITREEFAELATKLYEVYIGQKAAPAPADTFTDTTNPEILKAYQLGIVAGVGNNKYAPQVLINREQIAAMLNRAARVIKPGLDESVTGAPSFADEKAIESYFIPNVKFMAKNSLMGSVGSNRFAPKDNCTREQAVLIALRLYEKYK